MSCHQDARSAGQTDVPTSRPIHLPMTRHLPTRPILWRHTSPSAATLNTRPRRHQADPKTDHPDGTPTSPPRHHRSSTLLVPVPSVRLRVPVRSVRRSRGRTGTSTRAVLIIQPSRRPGSPSSPVSERFSIVRHWCRHADIS